MKFRDEIAEIRTLVNETHLMPRLRRLLDFHDKAVAALDEIYKRESGETLAIAYRALKLLDKEVE